MSLVAIRNKVRNLIDDLPTSNTDIYSYMGIDSFILREANIVDIVEVSVNGVSSGVTYTLDTTFNKITITSGGLLTNDLVEIPYSCYLNYSDTQIDSFISNALDYLNLYYTTFVIEDDYRTTAESGAQDIFPSPSIGEESLIAVITAILINPKNVTIALPDIKITPSEKVSTDTLIQRQIASYKKRMSKDSYEVV